MEQIRRAIKFLCLGMKESFTILDEAVFPQKIKAYYLQDYVRIFTDKEKLLALTKFTIY